MIALRVHSGTVVPLDVSDVDTDQILPAQFLKRITRHGYEDALFAQWRTDPEFVLNGADAQGATILIAGPNFGVGSSREHAVWALQDWGFRVVVSSRFGDIFRSNAGKCGLLAAAVEPTHLDHLLAAAADGRVSMTVDLEQQIIQLPDGTRVPFSIDEYTRWRILNGFDEIAITMQSLPEIESIESHRPSFMPVVTERTRR